MPPNEPAQSEPPARRVAHPAHDPAPERREAVSVRELHIRFQYPPFWRLFIRHGLLSLTLLLLVTAGGIWLVRRELDRLREAEALANAPPSPDESALAVMDIAERGMLANQPLECAAYVMQASRWNLNRERVRNLFPYLYQQRQWQAIVEAERAYREAHTAPDEALCAIGALLHERRTADAATVLIDALERWPDEPRLLKPLVYMRSLRGPGEWERRFATHLMRSLHSAQTPMDLYPWLERCFQMQRPDLGWRVFEAMQQLSPGHPVHSLATARFHDAWFRFRMHFLGIPSDDPAETIDIAPLFLAGRYLPTWERACARVPLGMHMACWQHPADTTQALRDCIAGFRQRMASGRLAPDETYAFADALALAGDPGQASAVLSDFSQTHPAHRHAAAAQAARIHRATRNWNGVYDALYRTAGAADTGLEDWLLLANAQRRLGLGLAAWYTARRAVAAYPASSRAVALLAQCQLDYGDAAHALFTLDNKATPDTSQLDALEIEALVRTGRLMEMDRFRRAAMIPAAYRPLPPRPLALPAAELALLWHIAAIPSRQQFAEHANKLRTAAAATMRAASPPFPDSLFALWAQAVDKEAQPEVLALDRWKSLGRTPIETAAACFQLVLIQCSRGDLTAARLAVAEVTQRIPDCPLPWRAHIGLSGGAPAVIAAARNACPQDGDIWLADLVTQVEAAPADQREAVAERLTDDVLQRRVPVEARVRGGEYLRRAGLPTPAARLARAAESDARSLVPAHILALRCALDLEDFRWAEAAVTSAIEALDSPQPMLRNLLVALREQTGNLRPDPDLIDALQVLHRQEPNDPRWARMLGEVRFQRGGFDAMYALSHLSDAIDQGARDRYTYLLAAEAARQMGNLDRSIDLLREGLDAHPDALALLNNLVYTLALRPNTHREASLLLPRLLVAGKQNLRVLDTAALVYLRTGNLDMAKAFASDLWRRTEPGSLLWVRAGLNLTEIALRQGHLALARDGLQHVLDVARGIPDEDTLRAGLLHAEIERRQSQTFDETE